MQGKSYAKRVGLYFTIVCIADRARAAKLEAVKHCSGENAPLIV